MALTRELIIANPALANIGDEAISAIVALSTNDEKTVIGTKIGELHGQYDADVLSVTGIAKKQGEKSYDYVKRVMSDYKSKVGTFAETEKSLNEAREEAKKLKKQIEDGSTDEAIKKQLKDAQAQVIQLQGKLESDKTEFETKISELQKSALNDKVDSVLESALSVLKFKSSIPESVKTVMIKNAKAEVLAKGTPDFIEDGKGNKTLVFRDENGNTINNPNNKLNPFTASELLSDGLKDIIDFGKKQEGGGTGGTVAGSSSGDDVFSIDVYKTQVEADEAIEKHLMGNGFTRATPEYVEEFTKLRTESNVSSLPIR